MFITLTLVKYDKSMRFNFTNIIAYVRLTPESCEDLNEEITELTVDRNITFHVKETPEEIDEMVKKCLNS